MAVKGLKAFPCSRCGGSGKMPYSLLEGMCFKCHGSGKQLSKPAAKPQRWTIFFPWREPDRMRGTHCIDHSTGKTAAAALSASITRLKRGPLWPRISEEGAIIISETEDKPRETARFAIEDSAYQEAQRIFNLTGVWPRELSYPDMGIPHVPVVIPDDVDLSASPRWVIDETLGVAGGVVWQSPVKNPTPRTFIPPPAVAKAAREGLQLRESLPPSRRGGTAVGIRRAVQLANRQPVSIDTLRRMVSFFARHAVDARAAGWGVDSRGWVAHLLWGGSAGQRWAKGLVTQYGGRA